jgi:hypothetical protein
MSCGLVSALPYRSRAAAIFLGLLSVAGSLPAAPPPPAPAAPAVWSDEAKGLIVITTQAPAAGSKENIQNQAAAFVVGLVNSGSVAPQSVRALTLRKLPALELRGDLLTAPKGIKCTAIIAFSRSETFIVQGMGPADMDAAFLESHCAAEGSPLGEARGVLEDLAGKMKRELAELRRLALAVQARQQAENRQP